MNYGNFSPFNALLTPLTKYLAVYKDNTVFSPSNVGKGENSKNISVNLEYAENP
jgi:hypothetical protein